jgi:hypothetical protein
LDLARRWDQAGLGALLLQEYEQIKEEQTQRISTRDNLIYAALVSVAGVVRGAGLDVPGQR